MEKTTLLPIHSPRIMEVKNTMRVKAVSYTHLDVYKRQGMMRLTEIILSIPSILIVIFIQAIIGQTGPLTIAFVIGVTSWMNISKIVRSEVRQIRNADYILAAKTMDGDFFYILRRHLLPNFVSSIMFMVVTNIGAAIGTEATLSFLGIGLPVEIISWGKMCIRDRHNENQIF